MSNVRRLLAYFSASCGAVSLLAGAFLLGIAYVSAGQRAPYAAGFTCISSATVLLAIAILLFHRPGHVPYPAALRFAKS